VGLNAIERSREETRGVGRGENRRGLK